MAKRDRNVYVTCVLTRSEPFTGGRAPSVKVTEPGCENRLSVKSVPSDVNRSFEENHERAARAAIGFGEGNPYAGRLLFSNVVESDQLVGYVWMVQPSRRFG